MQQVGAEVEVEARVLPSGRVAVQCPLGHVVYMLAEREWRKSPLRSAFGDGVAVRARCSGPGHAGG